MVEDSVENDPSHERNHKTFPYSPNQDDKQNHLINKGLNMKKI